MHEVGIGPSDGMLVYGADGNMGNALGEGVAPGLLNGMKGTTPLTELGPDFQERLRAANPGLIDFNYAGESYDAVVISALAAEQAESTAGVDIAANINAVTQRRRQVHLVRGMPLTARCGTARTSTTTA